jgi:N-acyl-D-amino-acid deacylase
VFATDLHQPVPAPYGEWCLEAMDSHGGWIATASDLARFAAAFDDPDSCPVLSRESIDMMFARPPGIAGPGIAGLGLAGHEENGSEKPVYYSLGWNNRVLSDGKINHWHTGSLPGTATILIRRHDGRNFVALMNSRVSPSSSHLGQEIDKLLHQMADEVKEWP